MKTITSIYSKLRTKEAQTVLSFLGVLFLWGMALTACSHIDEADRLIYVEPEYKKPDAVPRVVLLEDFTGQRCTNCPKGTEIIEQLQQQYGDTAFVAVGIHSGPLGFKGNAKTLGLASELGDEYYNHWGFEYQPVGLVNRQGAVNYTDWTAAVIKELAKPATLSLGVTAKLNDSKIDIIVSAMGTDGSTQGKLQVWIVEDGITALQLMPDGSSNANYVHNHVLRAAVNGAWGEDISVSESVTTEKAYNGIAVADDWNTSHLSIVAFVYNDQGVQQATRAKVE